MIEGYERFFLFSLDGYKRLSACFLVCTTDEHALQVACRLRYRPYGHCLADLPFSVGFQYNSCCLYCHGDTPRRHPDWVASIRAAFSADGVPRNVACGCRSVDCRNALFPTLFGHIPRWVVRAWLYLGRRCLAHEPYLFVCIPATHFISFPRLFPSLLKLPISFRLLLRRLTPAWPKLAADPLFAGSPPVFGWYGLGVPAGCTANRE